MKKKNLLLLLVTLFGSAITVSCGGNPSAGDETSKGEVENSVENSVEENTFQFTESKVSVKECQTHDIVVETNLESPITWSIDDPTMISADTTTTGKTLTITGLGMGDTFVTASIEGMEDITIDVTVTARITLDGDLSEWKADPELSTNILSLHGQLEEDSHRYVEFYGTLTNSGLYLAAEAKHDSFAFGNDPWWKNTNFEMNVGLTQKKHVFVFATGTHEFDAAGDGTNLLEKDNARMVVTEPTVDNPCYLVSYEVFFPTAKLEADKLLDGDMIRVGVAYKVDGIETISGGECNEGNPDAWWVPKGTFFNNSDMPVVNSHGIFTKAILNPAE